SAACNPISDGRTGYSALLDTPILGLPRPDRAADIPGQDVEPQRSDHPEVGQPGQAADEPHPGLARKPLDPTEEVQGDEDPIATDGDQEQRGPPPGPLLPPNRIKARPLPIAPSHQDALRAAKLPS